MNTTANNKTTGTKANFWSTLWDIVYISGFIALFTFTIITAINNI